MLAQLLADIAGAVRFFSRLPVPKLSAADDPAALPAVARAGHAMPIAGLAIALPVALLAALLAITGLPPLASGLLLVAAGFLVTGGLHEDGLADSADGLIGGQSAERRLAIMKDSRIGAHGAAALAVVLMLKASLLGALVAGGPAVAAAGVLFAAAASRALMVILWAALPSARPEGLAAAAGRPGRSAGLGALLAALVAGGLASLVLAPAGTLAGLLLAAGAVILVGLAARRLIGGQTGDILGAAQQIGEAMILLGLAI